MRRVVTFGEAMLRLSAQRRERLEQARTLDVWPAGAELNVAVALARLGTGAAWVSRLPASPLGRLVTAHAQAHGVDVSRVRWTDGGRLGLYFTEIGEGVRPTSALYDRAGSAFARLDPADFPWDTVLEGADAFHVSGITPALSPACAQATDQAVAAADDAGLLVSYDVNLRRKLTTPEHAREMLERFAPHLDLLLLSERDARAVVPELDAEAELAQALRDHLEVPLVVLSARDGETRTRTGVGDVTEAVTRPSVPAVDPIGSGDAFCAGLLHGLLAGRPLGEALALGDAVAALKLSIPGDAAIVQPEEVDALLAERTAAAGIER